MASKKPIKNEKGQFVKGQSGNPKGRPKLRVETVKVKNALRVDIARALHMLTLSHEEIKEREQEFHKSVLHDYVMTAIQTGDWKVISNLLDRLMGKPQESVDHTSSDNSLSFSLKYSVDKD